MPSFEAAQSIRRHEATSGDTGAAFFRSLARSVAQVFGTRYAFVGEAMPGSEEIQRPSARNPTSLLWPTTRHLYFGLTRSRTPRGLTGLAAASLRQRLRFEIRVAERSSVQILD